MKAVVVDTNVCVVANGRSPQADATCVQTAVRQLREARRNCLISIDDAFRILREYGRNLRHRGQPGPGDEFYQWLLQNRDNRRHCEQVAIIPKPGTEEDYEEFPQDPELAGFDRSDRKFVAVVRASRQRPQVLNAVDTDWWHYREPLLRHGVEVEFLCPHLMKASR